MLLSAQQKWDASYGSGCTGFRLQQIWNLAIFRNPAKSGFNQISSWIWRMPVLLQYLQLITDKTNAAEWLVKWYIRKLVLAGWKIQNSLLFHKFCQKLANDDVTMEAWTVLRLIAATALLTPLVSSGILFCVPNNKLFLNQAPAWFEFLNSVKSGTTLVMTELHGMCWRLRDMTLVHGWLGSVVVRLSDSRSTDREFDSWLLIAK